MLLAPPQPGDVRGAAGREEVRELREQLAEVVVEAVGRLDEEHARRPEPPARAARTCLRRPRNVSSARLVYVARNAVERAAPFSTRAPVASGARSIRARERGNSSAGARNTGRYTGNASRAHFHQYSAANPGTSASRGP